MKTLSLRQPYAWLLVNGIKDVENRTWTTTYRGPLLIHASAAKITRADVDWLAEVCADYEIPVPAAAELPTGGIVGVVWLADITPSDESEWWDGESLAWIMSHYLPLDFEPCKGKLGLWEHPAPDGVDLTIREEEAAP